MNNAALEELVNSSAFHAGDSGIVPQMQYKSSHPRQMGKVGIRDTGHSGFKSRITCWSCHNRVRIKKELP